MTTTAGVHRKLAAILCADAESFSRLIADDPEATIEACPGIEPSLPSAATAWTEEWSTLRAPTCSSRLPASPRRCSARWGSSTNWPQKTPSCPKSGACAFASAAIWAM